MKKRLNKHVSASIFIVVLFLSIGNYKFNFISADALNFLENLASTEASSLESQLEELIADPAWLQEARLMAGEERKILEELFSKKKSFTTRLIEAQINKSIIESEYAYKNSTATIRQGKELSSEERVYRAQRLPIVHQALQELFKTDIAQEAVPTIAIVASGGGYRAMNGLMGSLLGAQKAGILDTCTYITALSGSTWLVAPWILSGLPLEEYKKVLKAKVAHSITLLTPRKAYWVAKALLTKKYHKQPVRLVDLYGALLAGRLLSEHGNKCQQVGLSDLRDKVDATKHPFPVCTAVRAEPYAASQWYEFTPYEIGGSWLERFVPTWAYGRAFNAGTSADNAPEQSLGFQLGTFGSGMGANLQNIFEYFNNTFVAELIPDILEQNILSLVGQKRFTWAEVNNFVKAMPNTTLSDLSTLRLVDAGARPGFNLPYPPISEERPERKADIIIMLDYSYPLDNAFELRKTEEYARERKLKFPIINYTGISTRLISIFKDEHDPEVPVVVYMPLLHDENLWVKVSADSRFSAYKQYLDNFNLEKEMSSGYCSTFNFKYSEYQFEQLSALTEFAMRASSWQIMHVLWDVILKKQQKLAKTQANLGNTSDILVEQADTIL